MEDEHVETEGKRMKRLTSEFRVLFDLLVENIDPFWPLGSDGGHGAAKKGSEAGYGD